LKTPKTYLLAATMSIVLLSTSPSFAAPTSIQNGDFEAGENLATTFDGWTLMNQRIDLGSTSIAGCTTVDTSDYLSLNEFFAEGGKEFFGDREIDSDPSYDYRIFLNADVYITSASVNLAENEITYTAPNDYEIGDLVYVVWNSAWGDDVIGAAVTDADSTSFTVAVSDAGSITDSDSSSDGGTAKSYVTALGFPFGFATGGGEDIAFLQTSPSTRLFEENWSPAQRAAVSALTRDPEAANDSLAVPFEGGEPEFLSGLRTNSSESDVYESWQGYLADFQRESQFVTLFSEMDAEGDSMNRKGYVIHGPAIYSEEFTAKSVDDLSFSWAASDERDDYKVFGYLLNTANCSQTEVLDSTGERSLWETVSVAIPSNGTYRFVFVSGTYDQNWGSGGGAVMFLDDVTLSPNAERVAAEAAAASNLAKTGVDFQWLLISGVTAALAGSGLIVASRRKRA
jgi:LPXTG-motif cell wall-anchored protein